MAYLDYPGLQRYHGKVQGEINELKDDLNSAYSVIPIYSNGGFGGGGVTNNVSNRIRTTYIPFKSGDTIIIYNGTLQHACGMWSGATVSFDTNTRNDNTWNDQTEIITPDYSGNLVVVFRKSTNADLTIADYDGKIEDYHTQIGENTLNIEKLTTRTGALEEKSIDIVPGELIYPQWVRGYRSSEGGRPLANPEQMDRYICTYDPIYLYKGSYFYCDTSNLYRYVLIKYSDSEGYKVASSITNIIPLKANKVIVETDGYYGLNIFRYDNGRVNITDMYSHVTFGLYSNKENPLQLFFVGGGKEQFQAPGDSNIVIGQTGTVIMIDGALNGTQGQLNLCMNNNGITEPDYIIISHMHDDHIGGLVRLLDNNIFSLNNKTIFLPSQDGIDYAINAGILSGDSLTLYNTLMGYINNATNLTVIRPSTEFEEYYIDGMTIRFWNVDHQPYIDDNDTNYNDFSLCNNIVYGNQRICYSGDIGTQAMALNAGKNYKCNIYKAQHHGWDNIISSADVLDMKKWLSTVFPEIVVSEDGIAHDTLLLGDNAPMPDWCEDNGIPFYRTNQNGFIHVRVSKDSYDIVTPVIRWTKSENQA